MSAMQTDDPNGARLAALWAAYRTACPAPEPAPEFLPRLWEKIEARRAEARSWFAFKRWAQACAAATAVLLVLMQTDEAGRQIAYGLVLIAAVTAGPDPQTLQTASYGANRLGLVAGGFVFLDPGGANEEYVRVISVDPESQSFQAIVTKDHAAGERIRPTIWPTPVLNEGDDLAFDILAVASPDPGADLTVVVQT